MRGGLLVRTAGHFGRRPIGRLEQQGPRRVRQHTAAQASGGGSGGAPGPSSGSSGRFSWAKWVALPAAAAAVLGSQVAGAVGYDAARNQRELEEGHKRAEKSLKAAERWVGG